MKRKKIVLLTPFVLIAMALLPSGYALAARATLNWNANSESDLAGYKIYWGTSPRTGTTAPGGYANTIDAHNVTTYTIDNIPDTGTTYFSITAYNTSNNESNFSVEVKKKPGNVNKDEDGNYIGIVDSLDIVAIINCLEKPVAGACRDADVDVSNDINSLDIMGAINNLDNKN